MNESIYMANNSLDKKLKDSAATKQSSDMTKNNALAVIYKRIEAFQFKEAQRLLTQFKLTFSNDIEYKFLTYNIVSIVQSKDAKIKRQVIAREILSTIDFMNAKVESVAKMWRENKELMSKLSANQLRLLGYKLSDAKDLTLCEQIVEFLLKHFPSEQNSKLIHKLAQVFAQRNNQEKRLQYVRIFNGLNSKVV